MNDISGLLRDFALMILPIILLSVSATAAEVSTLDGQHEPSPWRLACRLANYGKYQDIALQHIQEMGLRYVFLSIPKPDEVEDTLARLQAHGLQALVVRGDTNLSRDEAVEELAAQLAICERMEVRYMFLSPKRHDAPKEEVFERLRRAGDAARQHGVMIVLETHPDLGTNGAVHVETMQAINHPNVRVNFDTANITYYNNNTDALRELTVCQGYVETVEVKDHDLQLESWYFPALGEGRVDISAIFRLLRARDYEGPITLEVEGIQGIEWSEADTRAAMEKSVAHLRSIERFE